MLTEIRNAIISRMTAQTAIASEDVSYPNGPTYDPSGKSIWARLTNIPGMAAANEIGAGPVVQRTGIAVIQIFVPAGSGSLLITQTADKLRELFEFETDETGAKKALLRGGGSLERVLGRFLDEVSPTMVQRGDVAVVENAGRRCAGVFYGGSVWVPGESGLVCLRGNLLSAWRVR